MVVKKEISLKTKGFTDIIDITEKVQRSLGEAGLKEGILTVFVPGSTGGLTTLEYEPGLISDLKRTLEAIAPQGGDYEHNRRWQDGNGFSHIRSALIGPSLTLPFSKGRLTLGTWQQIIFIDFDNRPRSRTLIIQIIGE
ncbi:MAG TPA: YjbQ family protein [Candidatus Omnitrophica bacterium]|nr:MAG: YjbQ family protein [Candidatus Omnitrophota bacterium]RKY35137.1 MAG: YjbQ family protein [Candidatus Omnitrophota bacterium]RKY43792.1 MAG: YjbQ family protein [Candidatus Omnitrophota bacterium]HEC69860.1 YjbQ family protein [Candidatus Omnitrophota bacterium]